MTVFRHLVLALLAFGPLSGCVYEWGAEPVPSSSEEGPLHLVPEPPRTFSEKSEKVEWGPQDRPDLFSMDLEYSFETLPLQGEADQVPWAGSYWPVWQDSINYRWAGSDTLSPAAKYGEAFGVENVEALVSAQHGIDRYSTRTPCEMSSECDSALGESCAIREGEDAGFCIPTWWGICHAWAPVSILEAEPKHSVERNGVVFEVNDIKALLTLVYNRTTSRFVSLRCNEDEEAGEISYDAYERPTGDDTECADTNPGTFHVILANYLGVWGESFVEDRTFDDEVWNQPMRGYRVLSHEEVDASTANSLVGVEETDGEVLDSFSGLLANQTWVHRPPVFVQAGTPVEVSMTGTGDADLYVRLGAQPTTSEYDCRPYTNSSDEVCTIDVPQGGAHLYVSVRGYSGDPSFEVEVERSGVEVDEYLFNDNAERFVWVVVSVDYISESPSGQDGHLASSIDSYTGRDLYQYILELDAEGAIIGGEWVGASKQNHPDFLWLPEGRAPYHSVAGGAIRYELVKELLDASLTDESDSSEAATVELEGGSLLRGEWAQFGPFDLESGAFTAVMTGTGDADLYVRRGAEPTTSHFDCRPYRSDSDESCELTGAGPYYLGVRGYRDSTYELTVVLSPESATGSDAAAPDASGEHLEIVGSVSQGEMLHFGLDLQEGQTIVVRTTAPDDVDLYLRFGEAPTTWTYDLRGYTVSGNETLEFTASMAGRLHIGVHGWNASDFTLATSDE
ncbi:MAG: pre-peptidase C-terminal domain-containing protein [Myxococcota bacterium]|nr:pre-peptidase C-terminal domain-containing protein [Myxococcota bacterium]